jgi:tetratricopeptide (TPR) repeat protein
MRAVACVALGWLLLAPAVGAQIPDPERDGWRELSSSNYRDAAAAFQKAIAAQPRNARLYLGAGVTAFLDRRDADAQRLLRRALELDSSLTDAREVLGLVLYRSGDLHAAIREYDGLAAFDPRPRVIDTLNRWRRESDLRDGMTLTAGNGFTLSFEGQPDAGIAMQAAASLERAAARVGQVLSALPLVPVPVVLYSNEQFRDVTRAPDWAAGAFDGIVRIPVRDALADPAELDRVIAHEFTHAVVHSLAVRGVPVWLNEGLATVLERDGAGPVESAVAADAEARTLRLSLLARSFGTLSGEQAQMAYGKSALAVRKMLDEAGGFAIANLLRDIAGGAPFERAFERRMSMSFAAFEVSLDQSH